MTPDANDLVIAHWGEHVNGGGDRVAWELVRAFEGAPLFVGWRNPDVEPSDIESEQLITGRLNEWALKHGGLSRKIAHLLGWQLAEPLREYDVLVTSGNEPLFYVPPTDQVWIAYIHHTNRRQSDQIAEAVGGRFVSLKLLVHYLIRILFDHNTHKPDLYVANSEQVKRRIQRYWGVPEEKIEVVYPPVPTHEYSHNDAETGDYYLTLSRLDWHKGIEDIVRAFNDLDDTNLVIAGDGPERSKLERLAGDNVEFRGYVDDAVKRELLSGAKAFVFNGLDEDFGIAPVEALAAGTPLIGVREGMTRFHVIDGKNGYSFRRDQTGATIKDAIERFEETGVSWSEENIESFAERFSVEAFHDRMRETIARTVESIELEPDWYADIVMD